MCAIARDELGSRKLNTSPCATDEGNCKAFGRGGFEIEAVRWAHVLLDGRPEDVVLTGLQLGSTPPA